MEQYMIFTWCEHSDSQHMYRWCLCFLGNCLLRTILYIFIDGVLPLVLYQICYICDWCGISYIKFEMRSLDYGFIYAYLFSVCLAHNFNGWMLLYSSMKHSSLFSTEIWWMGMLQTEFENSVCRFRTSCKIQSRWYIKHSVWLWSLFPAMWLKHQYDCGGCYRQNLNFWFVESDSPWKLGLDDIYTTLFGWGHFSPQCGWNINVAIDGATDWM